MMTEIGYAISSEEHTPSDQVKNARRAEEAGFSFAMISDHFHPWVSQQGHSPFVWSVIGGISQATERIKIGTGVTSPIIRIHPAIIAQAAATSAAMLPGRFILGLGSGENLNEHVLGDPWPPTDIRHQMLAEAVEIIELLFEGDEASYWGNYYTVENAQLFTLPDELPPIMIAASGPQAGRLAGEIGDGLISTAPDREVVQAFKSSGGEGKPMIGQVKVCWAEDESEARKTAFRWWPTAIVPGTLHEQLPTPAYFEDVVEKFATEEMVAEEVVCGPDRKKHLQAVQEMIEAGYDHVYIHQVGPNQEGFFDFYQREILPEFK
jgi:coenzyme F420-dependent glucose-6-phosphate dehydrogenase